MDFAAIKNKKDRKYRLSNLLIIGGVCFFIGRAGLVSGPEPVLCGSIEILAGFLGSRRTAAGEQLSLQAAAAVILLVVIGIGEPQLHIPAAGILAVFCGYFFGMGQGMIVSFGTGMILIFAGHDAIDIIWMMSASVCAGFFRGSSRLAAGAAVSAAALAAVTFELLPAGILLIIIPEFLMIHIEAFIKEKLGTELGTRDKNLQDLSLLFESLGNPRSRMAYEFKAMSQLCGKQRLPAKRKKIMRQKIASAGYSGTSEINGDSSKWAELPDGRFAIALSDGMGKGEAASKESSLAVTTVIKLLQSGLEEELVLNLLNAILLIDVGGEVYTTMDLGIIDPEAGEFHVYKIGAAPTLIKRRDGIELMAISSVPMGVAEDAGIHRLSTMVRKGDQIIMMTDGVVDSDRSDQELKWIKKLLLRIRSKDPQTVCDLLISEAAANYGDIEKDDMTVVTMVMR